MYFCSQKVVFSPQQAQQQQLPQPNAALPTLPIGYLPPVNPNPPQVHIPPVLHLPPQPIARPLVNTNVLSINLGELGKEKTIATGDCVFCQSCQAIFNNTSKITLSKGAQREWECMPCDLWFFFLSFSFLSFFFFFFFFLIHA
jgi:hypothetical protein